MNNRQLCRHYYPIRYAWHCAAGLHAPRDCFGCTRYNAAVVCNTPEDHVRFNQWNKAHNTNGNNTAQNAFD